MYKILLSFSLVLFITGCATYKVVPLEPLGTLPSNHETITVERIRTKIPQGANCFEPMLTIMTLGIIPTHCVERYSVSFDSTEIGEVKVTSMMGWVAIIMNPFSSWKYGLGQNAENEIRALVISKEQGTTK